MKKRLLSLVFVFAFILTYSQTIEIIGKGVHGNSDANLPLTNIENIDNVRVGAIFKGGTEIPPITDVQFYDADEGPISTFKDDFIIKFVNGSTRPDQLSHTIGYYEHTFNTVDAGGLNVSVIPTDKVHSFYAFVFRDNPSSTYKSYINSDISYHYQSGADDPQIINIPIETAASERNVVVKIPITELDDTSRNVIIDITAGSVTRHIEETTYNLGNSFLLGEYELENVAGDVDNISLSIYSPKISLDGEGDSFFVSGAVVDVDKVNEDPGCTLTWGYWKTHSSCKKKGPERDDTWDELPNAEETIFFKSGKDYCGVFATTPGKGGKYYILAHQYIAAELNFLNGADPSDAQEAFNKATQLFEKYSPSEVNYKIRYGGRKGRKLKNKITRLARILDDYNNGVIGPGHCDDDEEEEDPCLTKDDVVITPMPITSHGKIKFTATHTGRTGAYLFNAYGYPVCPLYNKVVNKGQEVSIDINGRYYRNGTYYVKIWNGCCVVFKRVIIRCY